MAPDREACLVSVVENVAAIDRVTWGEIMVDPGQVVILRWSCCAGGRNKIQRSLLIGLGHELQKGQSLRTERSPRDDVVHNADVQRITQGDGLPGARVDQSREVAVARRH